MNTNNPKPRETILLVEDVLNIRHVYDLVLKEMGYLVIQADSAEAALRFFEQDPGPHVDLLLTDIAMGKMDGKELAYRVGRISPTTRVLFCSGDLAQLTLLQGAIERGLPLIEKPVMMEELGRKIREVLDGGEQNLQEELWQAARINAVNSQDASSQPGNNI